MIKVGDHVMRYIPIEAISAGMILGRDIIGDNTETAAMLVKGTTLTEDYVEYLKSRGYSGVYISDRISEDIVVNEAISDDLFRSGIEAVRNENIGHIINVSTNIVNEIMTKDQINVDLIDLRSFDDYTFHHSVNVAVFAVIVGKKLGLNGQDISYLSQAAICHDLGKMSIPEEILNKPGKLTDEEYDIIKTHPQKSMEILGKSRSVSSVVKQAVYFHHENENGSGYPLQRTGDKIPILAKIIHAVDVYDALTSKRPYKDPYAPADAFEYLKGGRDILFDRMVVDAMLQTLPAYPPGIDVKLSDGIEAIVYEHTSDALRPKVKIKSTGEIIDLTAPEYSDIIIVESGIMPSDYVGEIDLLNELKNFKPLKGKETILLVDDVMINLLHIRQMLDDEYNVWMAKSGVEAIEYIAEHGWPDLMIVDIEMPAMDGYTLVKQLKRLGMKDTPFIFLSGKGDRETVMKCFSLGANDYIVKPATTVYLRERVAVALDKVRDLQ